MKSDDQKLLDEGMASLQQGRRTAEFERLLLTKVDDRYRDFLRTVLALRPAYSRGIVNEAYAAAEFIRTRNQFESDEACAQFIAETGTLSAESVLKAGKRNRKPVNDLLREMGVLRTTKNL